MDPARSRILRDPRMGQIASIASAEPLGSALFASHVGLLAVGAIVGVVLFQTWVLAQIVCIYVALLSLEKWAAARAVETGAVHRYPQVLALLCARAVAFNVMVVMVWTMDGDFYKLAAMALLVAATINIFVFHATYPAVTACVVGPIWLGIVTIVLLSYLELGLSSETFASVMVLICVTPYFYLALMNARARFARIDVIQEALTQSQKQDALGKLVAGVAHDFNNILAVTIGNAELLRDADEAEKADIAAEIIKAAERGASLSAQLLAFGRRAKLEPTALRMQDVLHDLHRMLDRVMPENIAVKATVQPGTPSVFVDRHQFETALLNLAINARDAMPNGGRLEIIADAMDVNDHDALTDNDIVDAGLYARVRVIDTGTGVSKEMQKEVFDPFFTTKAVGKGSGLGLSMVQGFAGQSGGTVQFQSELGKGTTVSLILPSAPHASTERVAPAAGVPSNGSSHVLLVEDDASVLLVLERQIRSGGHRVTVATTGQEAEQALAAGLRPDLLLTDLVMPGPVQGLELARIARDKIPDLPVIFLSGYPQAARADILRWSSTALILQKPIRRSELLAALHGCTEGRDGSGHRMAEDAGDPGRT